MIVAREAPTACPKCQGTALEQEPDVLDTWFSSGLFPFSTLGWPDRTADLERYYPNDVMMTGFDIIFFWVARMIMLGTRFAGDVPFRTVFINGLVRDEKGEKMSKTKGNDVNPLDLIDQYGTDAMRFTLVALATPGTDPVLAPSRLLGYRAFVNKLWNASRFVLMNLEGGERAVSYDRASLPLASRWILSRQQEVAGRVSAALAEFRFDQAANELYHFVWDELCDWYIEIAKSWFADPVEGPRVRAVLVEVLEKTLRLLHPVMPFVTEEIWQMLPHEGESIMVAKFPTPEAGKRDAAAEEQMGRLMRVVTAVRTIRATYEVDRKRRLDATLVAKDPADRAFFAEHEALIRHLALLNSVTMVAEAGDAAGTIRQPVDTAELRIPMAGLFDVGAETARLSREVEKIEAELSSLARKLDNPQFVDRAKPEVVREARERVQELQGRRGKIDDTLRELRGLA
jgi:valyl-tRNA synthetase